MKSMVFAAMTTVLALTGLGCASDDDGNGTGNGVGGAGGNGGAGQAEYQDLSAAEVLEMLADFDGIYDVSPHYDEGHLPYAVDAGGVDGLQATAPDLDPEGRYLVYCHADGPSISGAEALVDAGLKNVYRLQGNFAAWDALTYVDIAPQRAQALLEAGELTAIFDVSPVYDSGHLPGAVNAGSVDGLKEMLGDYDTQGTYLVYCHADSPAMAGAQAMEDAGFHSVYRLEGNFAAWEEAGYAIE